MAKKNESGIIFSAPIIVIVGHYGVGKTNLSLNMAIDFAQQSGEVTLVDLDIVNPYFRSSDYIESLEKRGVNMVAPVFANTALDSPSLSGAIYPVLSAADDSHKVIVDVGGDDVGARALGRFSDIIKEQNYEMYYVVNKYRNLTQNPQDAAVLLKEIEATSGLKSTGVINNSHLKEETTAAMVEDSIEFAQESADILGLPLLATTIPQKLGLCEKSDEMGEGPRNCVHFPRDVTQMPYLVRTYVGTPWEETESI